MGQMGSSDTELFKAECMSLMGGRVIFLKATAATTLTKGGV